jgi:hypothetical protein
MYKKILSCALICFLAFTANAAIATVKLYKSTSLIPGLAATLNSLQQKTALSVLFPQQIPKYPNLKEYFIYTEITDQGYRIYIDSSQDCKGVHSCNIGMFTAEKNGKPEIYTDRNNKTITSSVILKNKTKAYFTPAHAMGDFWPTNLQWQKNKVLYALTWQLDSKTEKVTILKMANSTKELK